MGTSEEEGKEILGLLGGELVILLGREMESQGRKIPNPRKLNLRETAASLRLWKVHISNYYRADLYFSHFVSSDTTWDIHQHNWGFTAEADNTVTQRSASQMRADCHMFLDTFASYLPDDYVVEKLTKNTTNMADVWRIVDEFYGVTLSSDTFLALSNMSKKPEETYRQFYLQLEGFVSNHLTKEGVKVDEVTAPAKGDQLTISIKNILVIMWLSKIHDKMVDCVCTKFASELRGKRQLIELMPRIADNVDNI